MLYCSYAVCLTPSPTLLQDLSPVGVSLQAAIPILSTQALVNSIMNFLGGWLDLGVQFRAVDRSSGENSKLVWRGAHDLGLFAREDHGHGPEYLQIL